MKRKMNGQDIYEGITNMRDDLTQPVRHHRRWWMGAVAAVLAVAVSLGVLWGPGGQPPLSTSWGLEEEPHGSVPLPAAIYPKMAMYPHWEDYDNYDEYDKDYTAWVKSLRGQRQQTVEYKKGLYNFLSQSMTNYLVSEDGENRVYSPLNIYMALAMTAEMAAGDSRQQILDLLEADGIDTLREQAKALWNAHYRDDGAATSLLANSVWMDTELAYVDNTMQQLADTYYATPHQGVMGSDKYNRQLQQWINDNTGDLLKEQAEEFQLHPDTALAWVSTTYYKTAWSDNMKFYKQNTSPQVFHGESGDTTADFMHQTTVLKYLCNSRYEAVALPTEDGSDMWLFLPKEGDTVADLIADGEIQEFLNSWKQTNTDSSFDFDVSETKVGLSVPKFDVACKLEDDFKDGLKAMGVTDVFDYEKADLSNAIQNSEGIPINSAEHAARVSIDEEGCTGAAYTIMDKDNGGPDAMGDTVVFTLDRPFIFAITGHDGLPLFVGTVNQME